MIKTLDIADFHASAAHTIWDVRDTNNYHAGHIAHATSQPLDTLTPERVHELLSATMGDIHILCGGGTKAARACQLLESIDPTRTYIHLAGGTRKAVELGHKIIISS